MGRFYYLGEHGLKSDSKKAIDYWLRAGQLGHAIANLRLDICYYNGDNGLEQNLGKAKRCFELSAIGGNANARHRLGCLEMTLNNCDRAFKHFLLAAEHGTCSQESEGKYEE